MQTVQIIQCHYDTFSTPQPEPCRIMSQFGVYKLASVS